MPPRYFETAADIDAAVVLGTTTESLYLDFKTTIDGFGADRVLEGQQEEACRDITQFANQFGGCLLVGLGEKLRPDKVKVADKFVSVSNPDGLREWLEQAITNYCVPATFPHHISFIHHPAGNLVAVNVPPSVAPIFLWNKQQRTMQVVGRNNHGKTYLNPDDVERLRMNGSRAAKIAFDALRTQELSQELELMPGICQWNDNHQKWFQIRGQNKPRIVLTNVYENSFDINIFGRGSSGATVITVPYGLVQECWRDIQNRMCIMLQLDLGVFADGTFTFVRR